MSFYRVCRVLLAALLVTCVACPPAVRAVVIDQQVEALLAVDLEAEITSRIAAETPAAIRVSLNYEVGFLPNDAVDVNLRIATIELMIRIARATSK